MKGFINLKVMKKFLAILMACALVFSMTACGKKNEPTKEEPTKVEDVTNDSNVAESNESKSDDTSVDVSESENNNEDPSKEVDDTNSEIENNDEGKQAYYDTYYGSEDMKVAGGDVQMEMLGNGESAYTMITGKNVNIVSSDLGKVEMYGTEDNKIYIHTYVKPHDDDPVGEDNWVVCDIPEGQNPFEESEADSNPDAMFEPEDENTVITMEYESSYEEDGVVYDKVIMHSVKMAEDPLGTDIVVDSMLHINAETHEIVFYDMESEEFDADGNLVLVEIRVKFVDVDVELPEGAENAEEGNYEEQMTKSALTMMLLMGMDFGGVDTLVEIEVPEDAEENVEVGTDD